VVHWRRGDQLQTRCANHKDQSVNCGTAQDLVHWVLAALRNSTNASISGDVSRVYVATNEPQHSDQIMQLHSQGFLTFSSVKDELFQDLDDLSVLAIEASLMLEAQTFFAWGVSEVDDVMEHERMATGRSFCQSRNSHQLSDSRYGVVTWCQSLQQDHSEVSVT
jgi:hypothetical protein